jgi:hypothetical protein
MDVCLTQRRNGCKAPTAAGSGLETAAHNALGLEGNPPACMESGEDPLTVMIKVGATWSYATMAGVDGTAPTAGA